MIRMTLDCVISTQPSVIQTIHCNVGMKCFFLILPKCLLLSLCMHISLIFYKVAERRIHGVVGYVIITLLHIVRRVCQWKNFDNWSIIGKDMDKSKVARFWPILYINFVAFVFHINLGKEHA